LNARDENELIEAVQEIRNEVNGPNQVSYLAGDISDEKICISLMEEGQITIEELQIKLVLQKNPEEYPENSL
jgi:hypothetical protein